jgi:alanine-glyoxylate transaminase / (R)-3-amino-2-methylpropionate-pyruvate transaminase
MFKDPDQYTPIETDWSYEATVAKYDTNLTPGIRLFRAYGKPLVLERGLGVCLWDADGKKYIDMMAQNLSISVGYNHPLVTSEAKKQIDRLQHATTMYIHAVPAHFGEELIARFPQNEDWVVHLVNSGAEAADLALQMAMLYTGHYDMIALRTGYHGVHSAGMALSGIQGFKQLLPPLPGIHHVANPDPYRGVFGDNVDEYVEEISRTIGASTPGRIAGFIVEPIQGFGGVIPMPEGYIAKAFERARAAGGICIVDEIQTGFGRTGENFWGFQAHGVVPDMVLLGKGIGNGFPLSAVVVKRKIAESMTHRKYFNTYAFNPICCAAGRAVLRAIDEDGLQQNAREVGAYLRQRMRKLQEKHDLIGAVRGMGLHDGVELVKDRKTKEPASEEAGYIAEFAKDNGVIIGKGGALGNILRMNPPMCIQKEDIDVVVDVLDEGLRRI